ncbi:MAG: tRNA epoxyqueuosine(34) reductase QueG [Candidatus Eremiobacteraeota bacterium]|nr:tRNA epoxyqueuosine(34) reductase QueG [Candidatus Eremiobacteraeota bacterium]MBV9698513.1 tRNA epoxyqueuosine(34) reductase QueG [Candidatus Eremiobacteraeota bacterium]
MNSANLNLAEVKERAVRTAMALGAASVRVVSAAPDAQSRRRMAEAFARGDFTTWRYDDRYARQATDPGKLLAGARSVLCVAVPYGSIATSPTPRLRGRVSNYAWLPDYHRGVRSLLQSVAREIDAAAGCAVTAIACDTRPLAERALAARSGLGWVGKHTNVISPEFGSFVFLGEIVTTLDLAADATLRKTCGSCRRCVDACPTRALRGDYTIDATRCISDLTQRADGIPTEMRSLVGDWVWGCDLCQLVCPPTVAAERSHRREQPTPAFVDLVALLRMRSGEFKRRYRATAMGWRGAAVLRRNAAVALGNSLDRAAVPALIESLRSERNAMVRGHVAWALGRLGSPPAIAELQRACASERDAGVCGEIASALQGAQGVAAP